MPKFNDFNLEEWKNYEDIMIDTLWIIDKRDNSGVHSASYHGNFIPQIPNQLFRRYTKKGDWILDPFLGGGTSIIEAQRLGRNSIGIELQESVLKESYKKIKEERNSESHGRIYIGNSKNINIECILKKNGIDLFQFIIYHPPYWDIIKFSDDKNDLSNEKSLDGFLSSFCEVIDNTAKYLEKNRYCALIIGDKYQNSQVIPLGFYCMNLFLQRNFILKGILVKNFNETKGKKNQQGIWRYRALSSDFFIFKHEYIMVFKKIS